MKYNSFKFHAFRKVNSIFQVLSDSSAEGKHHFKRLL